MRIELKPELSIDVCGMTTISFKLNPYVGFQIEMQEPWAANQTLISAANAAGDFDLAADLAENPRKCPGNERDAFYSIYYGLTMSLSISDLATPKLTVLFLTIPSVTLFSGSIFSLPFVELIPKTTFPRKVCMFCTGCMKVSYGTPPKKVPGFELGLQRLVGPVRENFEAAFREELAGTLNKKAEVVSAAAAFMRRQSKERRARRDYTRRTENPHWAGPIMDQGVSLRRAAEEEDGEVPKVINTSPSFIKVLSIDAAEIAASNAVSEKQPVSLQFDVAQSEEGVDMREMDAMLNGMIAAQVASQRRGDTEGEEAAGFGHPGENMIPVSPPWWKSDMMKFLYCCMFVASLLTWDHYQPKTYFSPLDWIWMTILDIQGIIFKIRDWIYGLFQKTPVYCCQDEDYGTFACGLLWQHDGPCAEDPNVEFEDPEEERLKKEIAELEEVHLRTSKSDPNTNPDPDVRKSSGRGRKKRRNQSLS